MNSIHNFNDVSDYLPILNSVIITDIIVITLLLKGIIKSTVLQNWYREFTLSAVIADVLIIVIGIIIARLLYPYIFSEYSLLKFLILAVLIQITHDILFYLFCESIERGKSKILDIFKDYGKEKGSNAIIADSLMMISSVLIASYLKGKTLNSNIIILVFSIYLVPYMVHTV
jgi:uncharacterized protein YacL